MSIKKINISKEDYSKICDASSSEFASTMLEIIQKRVDNVEAKNILNNYAKMNSYFGISSNNPIVYNEISNIFFNSVIPEFECVELSPINPFALNYFLTELSQNSVLSTIKNSEVLSDSSTSMALECAFRKKFSGDGDNINLASSSRLLRMQRYGNGKKSHWSQHFRACSLVSAFRNIENNMYESMNLQILKWLDTIDNLNLPIHEINVNVSFLPLIKELYRLYNVDESMLLKNSVNPNFNIFQSFNIQIDEIINNIDQITDLNIKKELLLSIKNTFMLIEEKIFSKLKEIYPNVKFNLLLNRKSGLNYYEHFCYEVVVTFNDGKNLVLVDGGITSWTGDLLSDSKEKCVTSGMGLEYISKVYKK